jgi:pimeloyl-ACP methyl ester carboxylesterase
MPHAEVLAESRKVIRLQLLNVELGLAGAPLPPEYSVDHEVAALGNTLDELAIEQADFAAWSYGGLVTLVYAIHNPHRVHSLTLIEPPAVWVLRSRGPLPKIVLEQQDFFQTLDTENISEEQLASFLYYVKLIPEEVDPRTLAQWPVWLAHRQSLRMRDTPHRHVDSIELVSAFKKPVLLVKGEGQSHNLHHDIIDVLVEELPNAQVVAFPGGHAPHIVSMEPFLERFTRFLSERSMAQ